MRHIGFGWSEAAPLVDQLAAPIARASIDTATHGRPTALTLWRPNGRGLRIQSKMHDLGPRTEVGVLHFRSVNSADADEIDVPIAFDAPLKVTKLIIVELGVTAESGVNLESIDGRQIIITAGAMPYSLAVRGLVETPHSFEPEYPLETYTALRLA
jgi:hypothetical protein